MRGPFPKQLSILRRLGPTNPLRSRTVSPVHILSTSKHPLSTTHRLPSTKTMSRRIQNLNVDEVPTLPELYNPILSFGPPLRKLEPYTEGDLAASPNAVINAKIGLINADVTSMRIDAIVNAANTHLSGGGGIDGAIHNRAGEELYAACEAFPINRNGVRCDTGQAKVTDAFRLPCRKIIHTPGPVWYRMEDKQKAAQLLRSCYRSSLDAAVEHDCRTIVFPPISTNIYGYPNRIAAEEVLHEVRLWLENKNDNIPMDKIVFTNVDKSDMDAYLHFIPKYFPPAAEGGNEQDRARQLGLRQPEPEERAVEPEQRAEEPVKNKKE